MVPLRVTGIERQGELLEIRWSGEAPPYQLQSCTDAHAGDWQNESAPTAEMNLTVQSDGAVKFFRVLSLFGNTP